MPSGNEPSRRVSPSSRGGSEVAHIPADRVAKSSAGRVSSQRYGSPVSSGGRGTIHGQVLGPGHVPVSDATVAISGGPMHRDIAALTGDDGEFHLADMLPGEYAVTAHKPGYAPRTMQVRVAADQAVTLELSLTAD